MPPAPDEAVTRALEQLETTLTDPAIYRDGNTQNTLAQKLLPLARSKTSQVGDALSIQLHSPLPSTTANLFEKNVQEPAADVARWYVLWAMGLNGQGYVPTELLAQPWQTPPNDREKYWQSVPAAAWTAAQIGQSDETTIDILIERLNRPDDPLWLKGDIIGALNVLTHQSFGYDIDAWQNWRSQTTANVGSE